MVRKQTTSPWWDDLRVALFLAREGSVRAAARTLGVSHSTVLRRLATLEAAMGVRLFDRKAEGYELTPAGQDVFDTARGLEETIGSLERRVEGRDTRLAGRVSITLPDPIVRPLLPIIADVARAFPDIEMTLENQTRFVDLAHREADIALRIADEPPPDLVGRRLAKVAAGVYGTARYLKGRDPKQLDSLDWISLGVDSSMVFARWIAANAPKGRIALRVSEPWALRDAVEAGLGVTVLPSIAGDREPGWKRVCLVPEIAPPLWILTHRDLRTNARVRVLRDALADAITRWKGAFEGRLRQEGRK